MSRMSNARHASLVEQLYAACGGVPAIVEAKACRLQKTQLYEFADPRAGAYMPADVIVDLEGYCGFPIYSRGMLEHRPSEVEAAELLHEVLSSTEAVVDLQKMVREHTADGHLDARERKEIDELLTAAEQRLRQARAANERGRP